MTGVGLDDLYSNYLKVINHFNACTFILPLVCSVVERFLIARLI